MVQIRRYILYYITYSLLLQRRRVYDVFHTWEDILLRLLFDVVIRYAYIDIKKML